MTATCDVVEHEIAELVAAFRARTLARDRWTHDAHLVVATWHVRTYGARRALRLLRRGIQRLNAAHGVAQTPTSGYHETITRFFVAVIDAVAAEHDARAPLPALVAAVRDRCGDRALPLRYYSRERLMSWAARTSWVEPDLHPLPNGRP